MKGKYLMFTQIIVLIILILLNAYFAATEIAFISLNDAKIEKNAKEGNKKAKQILKMLKTPSKFLATIQIGITLAGFLSSAFASDAFADELAPVLNNLIPSVSIEVWRGISIVIITIILSFFTLVFGELVPKRLAMKYYEKISYATSIGITELRDNEKRDFGKWLSPYECISVRESQAKALLEAILPHKEIYQVADPTFLLSRNVWQKLAIQPSTCNPYILLFTLRHEPILLDYCKKLSKESGLQLIELGQVQPEVENDEYVAVKDAGPKEFLGYIGNAELVITDSFHCTVFSLIMRAKNFYTYIAPTNNRGSRIIDLLDIYGLKNHLLGRDLKKSFKELMTDKIDTVAVGCAQAGKFAGRDVVALRGCHGFCHLEKRVGSAAGSGGEQFPVGSVP